jgi:hypothetical protein
MPKDLAWNCTRMGQSSQLMVAKREVPMASFHVRAGALEHLSERGRFLLQSGLLGRTQRIEGPTGRTHRGPDAIGQRTKRSLLHQRLGGGNTVAGVGRKQRRMPGGGRGRR